MASLLHDILFDSAERFSNRPALRFRDDRYDYDHLADYVDRISSGLSKLDVSVGTRVAILLPNCPEAVISSFGTSKSGGIFVPVNPLLRPPQILHILKDCDAQVLITTKYLFDSISSSLNVLDHLCYTVFVGSQDSKLSIINTVRCIEWKELLSTPPAKANIAAPAEAEAASILYTSGSTGRAKGVVVSHENLVDGARIVSKYLANESTDKIIAALPMSFDYGFSQVSTSLFVGAESVLTNYSIPQMLISHLAEYEITGLAGVPTMWSQLSHVRWPLNLRRQIRYITNSGGRMPVAVLNRIRDVLPDSKIYLMYGLTEAFRSTFLDPDEIDRRPDSIGKAIPEVDISVVRTDGTSCSPDEPGELVHTGKLVTLGYWNDPQSTARRFKPLAPDTSSGALREVSVWSGDLVRKDSEGFLYFIGRTDDMIKSSGYRISPTEIEEVLLETGMVKEAIVIGIDDPMQGQRIALAVVADHNQLDIESELRRACAIRLPTFMQPSEIRYFDEIPTTANGKPNRKAISAAFSCPITDESFETGN